MRKTLLALCLLSGYTLATEEGVPTLSDDFFHQFSINSTSWTEWGKVFNEDNSPLSDDLIRHSSIVKNILEYDYKINIPFDVQRSYKYSSLFRDAKDPHYVYDEKNGCGAATVRVLGSAASGSISATVPEVAFQNQTRVEQVRESGRKYNEEALHVLAAYCGTGSNREIEPALRDFLSKFEASLQVSGQQILAARSTENKANAARQANVDAIMQAGAKKKSDELKVAEERKQEAMRLANVEQQTLRLAKEEDQKRSEQAALEARRQAIVEHSQMLKSGKLSIKNIQDGAIYYDAKYDAQVILHPPLEPDHMNYMARGTLEKYEGGKYILSMNMGNDIKYVAIILDPAVLKVNGFVARAEGTVSFVGEFVAIDTYTTVSGRERYAPVFKALVLSN
ncbi:hypothetical protein JFU47_06425 [Pseudomonas sp. TH39(2020)]|uniref:hypothetical protein n=1 Tax=Pseudomonas sp. TH39(2020) TaxID=2796349 RepID=UPI00191454B0|nr:hypothetical protein [Pseudomonas sp. TH39(2020)]MBK5396355.1 hypothetical protein [Pseudomonas sp. TH39(2020)]